MITLWDSLGYTNTSLRATTFKRNHFKIKWLRFSFLQLS